MFLHRRVDVVRHCRATVSVDDVASIQPVTRPVVGAHSLPLSLHMEGANFLAEVILIALTLVTCFAALGCALPHAAALLPPAPRVPALTPALCRTAPGGTAAGAEGRDLHLHCLPCETTRTQGPRHAPLLQGLHAGVLSSLQREWQRAAGGERASEVRRVGIVILTTPADGTFGGAGGILSATTHACAGVCWPVSSTAPSLAVTVLGASHNTMLRRTARLRREYLYRKSLEVRATAAAVQCEPAAMHMEESTDIGPRLSPG